MESPTATTETDKVEPTLETNLINLLVAIQRGGLWISGILATACLFFMIAANGQIDATSRSNSAMNSGGPAALVGINGFGWIGLLLFGALMWTGYCIANNLEERTNHGALSGYVCIQVLLLHLLGSVSIGLAIGIPVLFLINKPEIKKDFKKYSI